MQLASERIIELIITTYTSSSSQQIDEAYRILIGYAFAVYPKSFSQIEDILAKNQYQIDINCKKALINLIKVQGMRILDTILMLNKAEDDVISKHKKLLHVIQHILDNKQIDLSLKMPVIELYMDLFLFFTPENWLRLISKSKYYFNTKLYLLAINLIEVYLSRTLPLKYRFLFCEQALQLLIQQSYKMVQNIINNNNPLDYCVLEIFPKYLELLTDLFREMTFEKFQEFYDKILPWDQLLKLFNEINHQIFGHFSKKYFYEIYSIIITSLGRCKLFEKYFNIVNFIRGVVLNQFHQFMEGENSEISTLSMLDSAIQYKLIQFNISPYDIFAKLIYPNYLIVTKYLQNQIENLPQVINFLNDATFYMESQSIQIFRNRIMYHLCKNNPQLFNSFKSLIYSFFCKNVSSFGNADVKQVISNANIDEGIQLWAQIGQKINQDDQLEIILLTTALSSKFFISDIQFIKKIDEFSNENEDYLLLHGNKKIVFYSLLLYKNYMDDIFNNNYSSFRTKIVSFALDHTVQILKEFSLQILKEKLQQRPIYEQFQSQINLIIKAMTRQYKNQLIPIIIIIFRQFGEYIQSEDAIGIIKETFSIWKGKQIYQNKKSLHLQLLKMFMKIQSCSNYFMHLIQQLLQIANQNGVLIQRHIQDFLQVMIMGLQTCRKLPQNFQQTLVKFELIVNNVSIMKIMNALIVYSNQAIFFNWLAAILSRNKLRIYEILLIHNLIYYGNRLLTYESIRIIIQAAFFQRIIKPNQFDYRNGKLSLIFLFLLKYNWKQTNDLLKNEDWSLVVEKGRRHLQNMKIFGRLQQIGTKPFIQDIYDLLYKFQNVYRWKYDIQMFLINQLDIFKYNLNDNYQFMYANLSFLACTTNLLRAHDFIKNQQQYNSSDSDDSINPRCKFQRLHREQQQIIKHFETPLPLKQADYFSTYRKIFTDLRNDEKSKKWIEVLFKVAFRDERMAQLNEVLRIQRNNEGNYRKINRIRRKFDVQNDS